MGPVAGSEMGMGGLADAFLVPGPNHDWSQIENDIPAGIQLDLSALQGMTELPVGGFFVVECVGPDGKTKWIEPAKNGVTDAGIAYLLSVGFVSGTQITAWFLGIIDNAGFTTFAPGDTSSSHGGWSEVSSGNYSDTTRAAWSPGSPSGGAIVNGTTSDFHMINGSALSVKGVFLVSNSTKGGTSGTLFSTAAFASGAQPVNNGDTLKVTYTLSATSTS